MGFSIHIPSRERFAILAIVTAFACASGAMAQLPETCEIEKTFENFHKLKQLEEQQRKLMAKATDPQQKQQIQANLKKILELEAKELQTMKAHETKKIMEGVGLSNEANTFMARDSFPQDDRLMDKSTEETNDESEMDELSGFNPVEISGSIAEDALTLENRANTCIKNGEDLHKKMEDYLGPLNACSIEASSYSEEEIQTYRDKLIPPDQKIRSQYNTVSHLMQNCQVRRTAANILKNGQKNAKTHLGLKAYSSSTGKKFPPKAPSPPAPKATPKQVAKASRAGAIAARQLEVGTNAIGDMYSDIATPGRNLVEDPAEDYAQTLKASAPRGLVETAPIAAPTQAAKSRNASALDYVNSFK